MNADLQTKYDRLRDILGQLQSVAVAFSAGADSTLLLKVALDTLGQENVVAVTGKSASLATAEYEQTRELTQLLGARHVVLETQELDNENYAANPQDRCYYCKTTLYADLAEFSTQAGIVTMINGVNADDLGDYRPGITAAGEHAVRSPMAEAGMSKEDVRLLSQWLDLPTFDKPASPCLSSRVQYGERITPEKLHMIERAEAFLKSLGIRECRVRHHGNLARIEVHPQDMPLLAESTTRQQVDDYFRDLGYHYVTLDLRGFRSGSMNEVIQLNVVPTG